MRRTHPFRPRGQLHQRGFTLIELIISITLIAAIATGLLVSMHTSLLALERVQARLDQNRRATTLRELVYRQLGGAMPVAGRCSGSVAPVFRGTATQLLMVSSYSLAEGARGYPRVVSYRAEPEPAGTVRLVADEFLFSGPFGSDPYCAPGGAIRPIAATARTVVIASGLAYCRFSYSMLNPLLGMPLDSPWRDAWIFPDLPAAIRIDLAPAAADPGAMPVVPFTVRLHLNRQYGEVYADN
jgi:prepilin-type N-terminal cleavage/methylation domain-containing protein